MDRQQPTRPLEEAPRACGERAPRRGFEPRTLRLTAACSTVELSGNDREGTPPQTKTIPDASRNVKRSKEVLVRSRSRGEASWANAMCTIEGNTSRQRSQVIPQIAAGVRGAEAGAG